MISGSLVVLLVSIPLPLNAPTQYCTTPPLRSPRITAPGLRYAVAAAGYKSEASDRSTKSMLVTAVKVFLAEGSFNLPAWNIEGGLGFVVRDGLAEGRALE